MELNPKAKINELIKSLNIVKGKTHQEFSTKLILAMIESRSVHYSRLAEEIDENIELASIERKVERYFKEVSIDYYSLAVFLISFIHHDSLVISVDRTEWDFGKLRINVLCAAICVGKMAIPFYFELLDNNSGNSNYADRILLFENIMNIVERGRVELLVMDREFIGNKWLTWLINQKVPFCVRVPEGHKITSSNGEVLYPRELLKDKKKHTENRVKVDGVIVNLSITYDEKGELLYLIGTESANNLPKRYKRRWAIEVLFQAIKKRGFDLESSRIRTFERFKKLFALVSIAYTICWAVGIESGRKNPVRVKKHGYPQYSVFRRGLNIVRQFLKKGTNLNLLVNVLTDLKKRIMWYFLEYVG